MVLGFGDPTKGMTRIWGHFVILVGCELVTFKPQIMLRSLKEEKYDLICKLPQNNPLVIFLWKKGCIVKKERKSASFIL